MAHGLLISVASLAAELRLLGSQASVVLAHGLRDLRSLWDVPGPGIEPVSSALAPGTVTWNTRESLCKPYVFISRRKMPGSGIARSWCLLHV